MDRCRKLAACRWLVGLLLVWFAVPAAAQPTDAPLRVARLVRQLGETDFARRRDADRQLEQLGAQSEPLLREAARSDDPEVRLRAEQLLERIAAAQLWRGSLVELRARQEPAAKALARLAELSGNHLFSGEQYGSFHDAPLDLDFQQATFWEALDDVCRRSENHHRPHYDARIPGLVISAGPQGNYPTAYAGPVRALVSSARRVYQEELDYEQLKSEVAHTFQLNLQMMWEERFRLVAYAAQPEAVSATTDAGVKLSLAPSGSSGWNVFSGGTRLVSSNLRLGPPPATARRLRSMVLRWPMVAVGNLATLETDELRAGKQLHQDDLTLTVQAFERPSASRCELLLVVARDLAAPEPPEVMFQENEIQLLDAAGRALRLQAQSNLLTERGVELKLTFTGDSAESVPKILRFRYPRVRARRDLELVFRDVPLPAGRPE